MKKAFFFHFSKLLNYAFCLILYMLIDIPSQSEEQKGDSNKILVLNLVILLHVHNLLYKS